MNKSRLKSFWKVLGFLFLAVFFLMNIMAYNHAKKFTRYSAATGEKRTKLSELSGLQLASVLLFGINNPKPQNDSVPQSSYNTLNLGIERKLEAWYIPADSSRGTVIIFHGYSGNKSQFVKNADIIHGMGWDVLLVDFYGCGGSEGFESTIGYKEAQDVKTAYDHVKASNTKPIVLYGSSMGSAAVMKAVSENMVKPDRVILECPFGNMRSAVDSRVRSMKAPAIPFTDLFMFWGSVQNGFWTYDHNPEDYARKINVPTLLLYGEKDERVPRAETDLIYTNLKGPKKLVTFPEAKHESYLKKYTPEWTSAVQQFLDN